MYQDYQLPTSYYLFCFAIGLIALIGMWKLFVKAGKPGWAAIIPIYNAYILLKIVGKPGWWLILYIIPVINIIFLVWTYNMLSKSFGKDEMFTVGLVFLGFIFVPILGFGAARYLGPYGDQAAFRAYQEEHRFEFEQK